MRANVKFRICLRVEGIDTSREMLRRSDAAFLPSGMPGRGYLQIGNENIELMQVAYTGETYPYAQVEEGGQKPKFYDVVVQLTKDLIKDQWPRTPWPPFLPTKLTLSDPIVEEYLQEDLKPLITLGNIDRPRCANPFIQEWLNGKISWHGVNWNRTAMRGIVGLADDPYNAHQIPLVVDLSKGHVVLFGASGWGKTTFMRTLITSLAATHSPDEFHAHVLDLGGRNLEVLRALPHVGSIIMPDERGYEERVQQLLRELNDIVDLRKKMFAEAGVSTLFEYNSSFPDRIEPAILVVIDNFAEFIETFGDSGGGEEDTLLEALVLLVRQAKAYGLHFVISATRLNVLSSKLYSLFTERLTMRLSDSGDYRAIVGAGVAEIDEIPGRGYMKVGRQALEFQVAFAVGEFDEQGQMKSEAQQIRLLGQQMVKHGEKAWSGKDPLRIDALPKTSSYRQVLSEMLEISQEKTFIDELKKATSLVWERNGSADHADWLNVCLGITSGNRKRVLQMEAKKDGVHGLIAGGTGSGKSELLMTMIVGLALNYPPDILNFVLVDYKGGGAFKPFEKLPHVVDIVTNLNKAAVHRMFAAINAEMRRRQAFNAETGTKDIVEYRRKGLHRTHAPYPHLFVIIDEYSEMIDDNPEFRAELESITRVGRAQGVNLILASQRPKGVTDQMRANIKLRLCLRVEEMDTSREMLRRPDAAFLPNGMPGRGYIQIGNENLELIQVSYTGENQPDESDAAALWPERDTIETLGASEDIPKLFDAAVMLTSELVDGQMAPKPWPGFLPNNFSLQSPLYDAQKNRPFTLTTSVTDWLNGDTEELWPGIDWDSEAMRPIAGLLDNPVEAWQGPLKFDLSRTHLAIFGDSGWGKTSFIRTLITSLSATHSPNEFHAYILDLGGRNYRSLQDLPHVGGVIYADDEAFEERLQRLLDKLGRMTDERQQILSNADSNNLYDYNERNPDQALPAVLVAIDNFAELKENYEALVEATITPLVRRSLSAGITFVVTGNNPSSLPSKLYNLFGERVTFKQANTDRYMDIVGRGAIEIDDIAGRGYIRLGRRPLLFHAAQPVGIFDEEDSRDTLTEADEIRLMARHMHEHITTKGIAWRNQPDPIDILPDIVPLHTVLEEAGEPDAKEINAIVGQEVTLQPALFNLKRMGPHFAVAGPPLSGKTTTLYNWVLSLASQYPPDKVMMVLVDLQQKFVDYGGIHNLDELPHVVDSISEVEQLEGLVANLKVECEALVSQDTDRAIFVIIDNFDDLSEEIDRLRELPQELSGLVRRYGRDGLHFIICGSLDSGTSELRRRVQSANYGIALRSAQAVDALRAARRPAALLRGKELPVGRGFIVKSGQTTMIQVATPYESLGFVKPPGEFLDEEERNAWAMDAWIEKIKTQYPDGKVSWAQPVAEVTGESDGAVVDSETKPVIDLLKRIILKQANGDKEEIATWNDTDVLLKFVKDALGEESGLDPSFFGTSVKEILDAAVGYFPEIDADGAETEEKQAE